MTCTCVYLLSWHLWKHREQPVVNKLFTVYHSTIFSGLHFQNIKLQTFYSRGCDCGPASPTENRYNEIMKTTSVLWLKQRWNLSLCFSIFFSKWQYIMASTLLAKWLTEVGYSVAQQQLTLMSEMTSQNKGRVAQQKCSSIWSECWLCDNYWSSSG